MRSYSYSYIFCAPRYTHLGSCSPLLAQFPSPPLIDALCSGRKPLLLLFIIVVSLQPSVAPPRVPSVGEWAGIRAMKFLKCRYYRYDRSGRDVCEGDSIEDLSIDPAVPCHATDPPRQEKPLATCLIPSKGCRDVLRQVWESVCVDLGLCNTVRCCEVQLLRPLLTCSGCADIWEYQEGAMGNFNCDPLVRADKKKALGNCLSNPV
eukprot:296285-Hanusia_phi.AAC.2